MTSSIESASEMVPRVIARKERIEPPLSGRVTVRLRLDSFPDYHPAPVQIRAFFYFWCRTSGDTKREVSPARKKRDAPALTSQREGLRHRNPQNRLSTYEASSPRYGDLETEGPWNRSTEGRVQVMACPILGGMNERSDL